jgi:hypothetical protein
MCCGPGFWRLGRLRFFACCPPFWFGPGFLTKEEEIAWLERYLEGLKAEVEDVEKRIAKLKGKE